MPTRSEQAGRASLRLGLVWATALVTTVAAIAAAVVAWTGGIGQEQARATEALVVPACCCVGALILTSRPRHPVGRTLLLAGAAWGLASLPVELLVAHLHRVPDDGLAAGVLVIAFIVRGLGWIGLVVVLPLAFPDGSVPPVWRRLAAATLGLFVLGILAQPVIHDDRIPGIANPIGLPPRWQVVADAVVVLAFVLGATCLVAGLIRVAGLWRHGSPLVRQQVGWFVLGLAVTVAGAIALGAGLLGAPVYSLAIAALPLAVGIAVLQHRLYEVDVLVNRALLYALLTSAVAAVYVLVVAGTGAMLNERGAGWLPWLATAAVAVAFHPLREAIQRGVNRVTYGAWDEPQALLRSMHARLEQALTPELALADVLATARDSLRLDSVAVTGTDGTVLAAAGEPAREPERRIPLVQAGSVVGELQVTGGRRRTKDDGTLAELAGALAPAVHAARLHTDLVRSRERLVVAREEERRRLRRDLHDGLGPALAGLTLKLDTARNLLGDAPLLREMRDDVQGTIADVRHLVEGLRPVSLDELGLAEALRRLVDRAPPDGPRVHLVTDAADSPAAAVEVAAYRIVQEALTNVLRHSGAHSCDVTVCGRNGSLVVSVADDGCGAADAGSGGSGLETMRERAEELGGSLELLPRADGGTLVRAVLPRDPS
jgi:signal transduction histidine kinase